MKYEGGVIHIDGKAVKIEEGELFIVPAGVKEHYTTPVVGDRPRVIISFGFLVPRDKLKELYNER